MPSYIHLLATALAAIILTTSALAQTSELTESERKTFDLAIDLAERTNNRAAIGLLRPLHEAHPDNADIAYNLGICYINASGNPDSTLYFLQKVEALAPDAPWDEQRLVNNLAMARAYQLSGRPDDALRIYDLIAQKDTDELYAEVTQYERQVSNTAKILIANPVRLTMRDAGEGINSCWNDYKPVLTSTEDTMFFTSRRPKKTADKHIIFDDGQFEEGVYMSVRQGDKWSGSSTWSEAKPVNGLIPGRRKRIGQETTTALSPDGNEMYLCQDGDIYVSRRDSATREWLPATPLPYPINTEFEENWAFVTSDGQELYISSDRLGGFGGKDIWLCRKLPNGNWGKPFNLGPGVNTEDDEDAPFFHEPTNVLYFSSTGHSGMGGYDIFYSPRNDNGEFEASKNIGYPISSADDDLYFAPSADRDRGYYASIRWNEKGKAPSYDIYEVEFEQPEQNTMAILAANVTAPNLSDVKIFTLKDGEVIAIGRPSPKTGRFVTIVTAGEQFDLVATYGNDTITHHVSTLKTQSYRLLQQPIDIDDFVFTEKATPESLTADKKQETTFDNDFPSDELPYTVQIMSLRKSLDPKLLRGKIEIADIAEYKYRDGWFVYTYGNFSSYSEARKAQQDIRQTTPYTDAFARAKKQYDKYIKSRKQ